MKDIERAKSFQRRLYCAVGREWRDEDFTDDWIYKPFGADWDLWYKKGLAPVKFCALCGDDDFKEDVFITNKNSGYGVRIYLCESCATAIGYPISQDRELSRIQNPFRFLVKFFKDMFSGDPWKKFDPELKLKSKLMNRIGTWEISKLTGILQMHNAFEQDFFKNTFLSKLPGENKLETFVIFINNFSNLLFQNKVLNDAEIVAKISTKIKTEGNPVHWTLAHILFLKDRSQEALIEAEIALKVIDYLESKSQSLPDDYKGEFDINSISFNEQRDSLNGLIQTIKKYKL